MLSPVPMGKLRLLILKRYAEEVTAALGEFGGVHLVDAAESGLREMDARAEIDQIEAFLGRTEALLERIGATDRQVPAGMPTRGLQELAAFFSAVERELEASERELESLVRESGLLVQRAERLRRLPTEDVPLASLRSLGHLHLVSGRISPSLVPLAQATLGERGVLLNDAMATGHRDQILVVTTRRGRWAVESDLQGLGFEPEELPEDVDGSAVEASREAESRLEQIRLKILACQTAGKRMALAHGPQLCAARRQLVRSLAVLHAQCHFGSSRHLVCIAGWVPLNLEAQVRALVEKVTDGTGVVEIRPADDDPSHGEVDTVPVQLPPNRFLRPFQDLVCSFGSPRYGEVDPSLFVGITFVLMFGIMFGDVGQGAVVALLGVYLWRTRRPALRPLRDAGVLLSFCGSCAVVFGFLYGSVFGYEDTTFLRPLWLSPMHDVSRLLGAAIVVGIASISVAILINVVNKVRSRRYFESVFDKFGVIGIVFYWGSLGIGLKAARAGELDAAHVVLLIVVPLGLLFLREPLHNLLRRRRVLHGDPLSFVLEACIETLETVTAFLGSTVSFVRVGAFALSHAALCLAIYSVADIMRTLPGGGVWMVVVVVLGNLLVIAMEGMVAMIQGVRLEYYELFSKFFAGDGLPFRPFEFPKTDEPNPSKPGERAP